MALFSIDVLISYLSSVSYLAIFFLFIATGVGLPIPEELTLLVLGYLARIDVFDFVPLAVVSFIAIFASDNLGFYIGRNNKKWINHFFSREKLALAKEHLRLHGGKTIFFSRFVCVLRVLFPIVAGSVGMSWKKFVIIDTSAILIMVPLFMALGYYSGPYVEHIAKAIVSLDRIVLFVALIVIVIAFLSYKKMRR
ncbi:MAG: DedA family protein [Candidatus Aenigmarchaeota archaeon]|nr:DedA family protein [Candidatus Aenigmarchaeota archaeon]